MEINILTKNEIERIVQVEINKKTEHLERAMDHLRKKILQIEEEIKCLKN